MGYVHLAVFLVFAGLLLCAAVNDIRRYRIPNWISLALIGVFPLAALITWTPPLTVLVGVATGVGVLAVGLALFAGGWLGGGDVKLFSAIALWLGWPGLATLFVMTALFGGLLAVALIVLRRPSIARRAARGPAWLSRLAQPGRQMPYGVAIALGGVCAWPISPFFPVG